MNEAVQSVEIIDAWMGTLAFKIGRDGKIGKLSVEFEARDVPSEILTYLLGRRVKVAIEEVPDPQMTLSIGGDEVETPNGRVKRSTGEVVS